MPPRARWRLVGPALLCVLMAGLLASAADAPARNGQPTVARCDLEGVVDTGTGDYLSDCVTRAVAAGHDALLVRLDTPGGSLEATRHIVRAFLASPVPVLVWVGPSGAHAGSAGVFIALASNVAAMAPGTNIGAAHPVVGPSGQSPEAVGGEQLARKVENDAVAFAESIAQQRGRNAQWAASAVRDSVSVSADDARALRVVEYVTPTEADFLAQADGRLVTVAGGESGRLSTRDTHLVTLEPSLSQRAVHALANPAIVYLLFLLAALGFVMELSHPGAIAPGFIGVVALVLALVASSAMPVRAGAVLLMLAGAALIVAELFVTSGLLGAAGVVLLGLGGLFLVDRFDPEWFVDRSFQVSWTWLVPTTVAMAGAAAYVVYRSAQTRRLPQKGGDLGLVGERGTTLAPVTPESGEVFVHGERWRATSSAPIRSGAHVVVRGMEGLTLFVDEVPT